ncbi:MAG: heavy metal-associated domain-containing protein [Phycisphaerales bacterium]|nr:heavy metal-associated domain-containing protein [Phycisphaerales bacterium]
MNGQPFAVSCRVYNTSDGIPSEHTLLAALGVDAATDETDATSTTDRVGLIAIGGSLVAVILSSACCWVSLLVLSFGASAAGASAFFGRWRPIFVVIALTMLALGFYLNYFRRMRCGEGCCQTQPRRGRRIQRAMLWASSLVVVAFIFFPSDVALLLGGGSSTAAVQPGHVGDAYIFDVEGMHCATCAAMLQRALSALDGVTEVRVDYDTRSAQVSAVAGDGLSKRVATATARAGFTAQLRAEPVSDQ